jgi:hypothetical protein
MVYCRDTSPYMSLAHPIEGDDSSRGRRNGDALGIYTWRHRDIGQVSVDSVVTDQPNDVAARYEKY